MLDRQLLDQILAEKHKTFQDLANVIGMPEESLLSLLDSGEIGLEDAETVCRELGVEPELLFFHTSNFKSYSQRI